MKKKNSVLVGFALETGSEKENAQEKLTQKNLDLIIGNRPDSFSSDRIKPVWVEPNQSKNYPRMKKTKLAELIAAWLERKWTEKI
jgi:phosphopantothenoylcysteine synthetase/decarboxylase